MRVIFEVVNDLGRKRAKSNLDRFDEMNNFNVECFLIRGHLEGQITHAKQAIIRATSRKTGYTHATHHTWRLVGRAIFCLLKELHFDGSNFCIRTRIGTIFNSKSTISMR